MKLIFVLTLAYFMYPTLACDTNLCTRTSGNYKAFIKVNRDLECYIENGSSYIKQNGKTIFSDLSHDHDYFGSVGESHQKYLIQDINHNGTADLVTTTYTGGSRCCYI